MPQPDVRSVEHISGTHILEKGSVGSGQPSLLAVGSVSREHRGPNLEQVKAGTFDYSVAVGKVQ